MLNHLASMEDELSRAKRVLKYTLLKVDWPQYTLKKKTLLVCINKRH